MTSLVSTAFRALAAGIVNSEITFYYRTIHNGKNVTSDDNMPLTAGPIPFRFTIR
jgi:hypothetical protein